MGACISLKLGNFDLIVIAITFSSIFKFLILFFRSVEKANIIFVCFSRHMVMLLLKQTKRWCSYFFDTGNQRLSLSISFKKLLEEDEWALKNSNKWMVFQENKTKRKKESSNSTSHIYDINFIYSIWKDNLWSSKVSYYGKTMLRQSERGAYQADTRTSWSSL